LHDNRLDFTAIESVLQTVAEEDDERHAVAQLVRAGRRTRSVDSGELVEQPMRRSRKAL
jgi:hypothetical protein